MKIKGVRYASSKEYLATTTSPQTWWDVVRQQGDNVNENSSSNSSNNNKMCEECMLLPVNNGNESNERTLVTDFQSPLFEGSLLLRIRGTPSARTGQVEEDDSTYGYFHGMNRRYQAVIQGRFLDKGEENSLSMTDCVTGMSFYRKYGKLPPKWIVKGALKVIAFFAPQLDCQLDGPAPRSITPLGSTPQVLKVENEAGGSLAAMQEEPTLDNETLLGEASDASTSLTRARFRKKAFDKLYASKSKHPLVDPTKVYTFEFLQHLVNFTELEIELGSFLGNLQLAEVLNGQPLQIVAGKHDEEESKQLSSVENTLWAFDIWHEKLFSTSLQYDD